MIAAWVQNLASYSLQIVVVVLTGAFLRLVLGLAEPRLLLRYWQALLGICLALPLLQPWQRVGEEAGSAVGLLVSQAGVAGTEATPGRLVGLPLSSFIGAVLLLGLVLRLLWTLTGLLQLGRLRRRAVWLPASGLPLDSAAGEHPARFYLSPDVPSPVTFGVLDPAILLPVRALQLDERQLRCILLHELEHVHRRHWLAALLEELVRIVFWFHPAIWWLVRRLRLAREQVIDARVISRTGRRSAYLEAVLEMARAGAGAELAAASSFLSPHELTERAALIIKEATMSRKRALFAVCISVPVLAFCIMAAVSTFPLRGAPLPAGDEKVVSGQSVQIVKKIAPVYPQEAKAKRIEGMVLLRVHVDEAGKVTSVQAVEGPPELRAAAVEAIQGWEYKPLQEAGKAVPFVADVTVNFKLSKDGSIQVRDDKAAPGSHGVVGGVAGGVKGGVPGGVVGGVPGGVKGGGESEPHPEVLERTTPEYPPAAKEQHIEGTVVIGVVIDEKGHVVETSLVEGPEIFRDSAFAAVRNWKWTPAVKAGRPVASKAKVTINYRLK